MLTLIVKGTEFWDEVNEEFITPDVAVLQLEHSLVSLSKWESKHQKPFLVASNKTSDETFDYIIAMLLSDEVPMSTLQKLDQENLDDINAYIDSTQSATTFGMMPEEKGRGEIITSELIYYWMVAFNIPWDAENWHLNRLFSLIRICNVKQSKPKKLSQRELMERNRMLNEQRRARYETKG